MSSFQNNQRETMHPFLGIVQGANGNEIKYIVEKVIFHLPDSYPDPKRIKEKPPFILSESTSQNVSIEIEVYFCKEAKLKKVNYIYDICINDDEVNALWTKNLMFPNPSKEFEKKLLLAGGPGDYVSSSTIKSEEPQIL
ncbi:Protein AF-9 like protein [Argiope bruennichi]|uniref:Protein AF-9 like protein n=1 Tax=Argiope bruennichi TaxID=94029 RepID=A0A8T0FDW3_ARGBR|nr:Protein AF-9 like protein [Argiope bruennichi]